ncbi:MAG: hypothetical protein OXC91_01855 [Rhodobacteraceae bacterium]|nr:hypothetical protein [Paracoccaceae bacterium]
MTRLDGQRLSAEAVRRHLPGITMPGGGTACDILIAAVQNVFKSYDAACAGSG